jgi:hypothetical protein
LYLSKDIYPLKQNKMKTLSLLAVLLCLLAACQKTPPQTPPTLPVTPNPDTIPSTGMDTTNFNNREIVFGGRGLRMDLNRDGISDFVLLTERYGDYLLQIDYLRFCISPYEESDLPINHNDEIPMLAANSVIGATHFPGYGWYTMTNVVLAQQVITRDATWWEGPWKDKFNQYVPLRIRKGGKAYYGWLEISFNSSTGKLIAHRAAISRQADTPVVAGR